MPAESSPSALAARVLAGERSAVARSRRDANDCSRVFPGLMLGGVRRRSSARSFELRSLVACLRRVARTHRRERALEFANPLQRIRQLREWLASDKWLLRNAVQAVLALLSGGYTTHPDVLPHLSPWFRCAYGR